jgi:RHS repeat-associated protein
VSGEPFAIVAAGESRPSDRTVAFSRDSEKESKRQKRWDNGKTGRARRPVDGSEPAGLKRAAVKARGSDAGDRTNAKMMSGVPATGTFYIYAFDGRLLAEYDVLGQLAREYIYFGGMLVAEYRNQESRLLYYTSDQINSTRIVTDNTGTVVYAAAHEPYGGIQKTWVSSYAPSLKFSGKERDAESDLDYFGARYYDRSLYRFLSTDQLIPIRGACSDPQKLNLYGYCRSNPENYIDLDGRQAIKLEIIRNNYTMEATFGTYKLTLGDRVIYGYTLEPSVAEGKGPIPEDEYDAVPYWWSKKGYQVYWIQDVPGFEGILIHKGSEPDDTTGCILVGKKRTSSGISDSKKALDEMVNEIADFSADSIAGCIANGLNDLDLMSYICSGRIRVHISYNLLPDYEITWTVVVNQNI